MIRRPPRLTRTDQPLPATPLFRSRLPGRRRQPQSVMAVDQAARLHQPGLRQAGQRHHDAGAEGEDPAAAIGLEIERGPKRSEEHPSELQSLMRTSYAVFSMNKKKPLICLQTTDKKTKPVKQQ